MSFQCSSIEAWLRSIIFRRASFAVAALCLGSGCAQGAVTKSAIFACRDQGVLKKFEQLRAKKDIKAVTALEAEKLSQNECIQSPRGATVGIDLRSPPMMCVRRTGDLDCYWVIGALIDEFPSQPGRASRPAASSGGRHRR